MIWLNVLVFLIIAGFIYLESQRGFGRALFDVIGGLLMVIPGRKLAEALADSVQLLANEGSNQVLWLLLVFLAGGLATVWLGKIIHEATLISLDVLDPAGGAVLGVAVGVLVSHMLLAVLTLAVGDSEFAEALKRTFCTQEFYHFRSYHNAIQALRQIGEW